VLDEMIARGSIVRAARKWKSFSQGARGSASLPVRGDKNGRWTGCARRTTRLSSASYDKESVGRVGVERLAEIIRNKPK